MKLRNPSRTGKKSRIEIQFTPDVLKIMEAQAIKSDRTLKNWMEYTIMKASGIDCTLNHPPRKSK